ncbi:SDR family NAD(P)-dependent oxidoreductase [Rhizobium sp. ZW T2_16]|uniref:SDR family NAD(P)-dependent oxidoreductase n=1 Tax=Rhizobium sp. ZW T2_16 TaxID=3378083 RepID=UPI000FAA5662
MVFDVVIKGNVQVISGNSRGKAGTAGLHAREAVRAMIKGDGGVIVNVASIVALVAMKDTAVYAASIGAITQLTKVIAVEYGSRGIRANAVAPGVIETDIREGRCHGRAL